jgi:hypothetical protein
MTPHAIGTKLKIFIVQLTPARRDEHHPGSGMRRP